ERTRQEAGDEEHSEAEEEEEEVCPAARFAASVGGPKVAKAKPAVKAVKATAAKTAPKQAAHRFPSAREGRGPCESQPKQAAKPKSQRAPVETLQLDGRGKRLKENLPETYQKLADA
ncbi:unnamed protein product, partial [Effrenium voratum]